MNEELTVKRKLFNKLKAFYNDKDFVIGVISNIDTDENYQAVIDFMDSNKDCSADEIIALSVLLDDATEKEKPKE